MRIEKYQQSHEGDVIELLREEEWDEYIADDVIDAFKLALLRSVTYVAYDSGIYCGYIRGVLDENFAVYISDLLVRKECRNRGIGQKLLERVKSDYKDIDVYVLSDEDKYYEKKRCQRVGSVFELE
jgi:ribosomal protein S18 acetylase RimI-like enzyme